MQYGFVIDHERCIGCHACTVACKSENDVPVGDFRTWVKYTEQGTFPAIRRHFAVLRCNHCSNAPCVKICPVNALEKRADGIVDIDRDACIGCRACMQACPYDAIYLNEDLGAVEKCHFCAHRVEKGLEPACAVVCPENAIIAGDVHDPNSTIAQLIAQNDTLVRRPEQKTGPNVHYMGALKEALEPGTAKEPATFLWSQRNSDKPEVLANSRAVAADTTTVLNAEHKVQWGWGVSAYLLTKGIAAGAGILAPFVAIFGMEGFAASYVPEIIALVFIGITGFLLVEDLKKPLAFIRLFTRPNWDSWLVKGAWVINAFIAFVCASVILRMLGLDAAADLVRWGGAVCGVAVAGYTAFLFAQCEGRDLWQSKILLPHLVVQAVMLGAAALMPFANGSMTVIAVFVIAAALHLALCLVEIMQSHDTLNATQAAAYMSVVQAGALRAFRDGLILSVGLGVFLAFVAPSLVWIVVLPGVLMYEHAYVRAGQLPPLS